MRWAILAVVAALAAVVAVNAALLVYAGDRQDPVGQLSPVANVQQPAPPVRGTVEHEDD